MTGAEQACVTAGEPGVHGPDAPSRAGRSLALAARFEERAFSPPELPCPRQPLFSAVSRDLWYTTRALPWAILNRPSRAQDIPLRWFLLNSA